jgi:hypothetical protein
MLIAVSTKQSIDPSWSPGMEVYLSHRVSYRGQQQTKEVETHSLSCLKWTAICWSLGMEVYFTHRVSCRA